MTIRAVLLTFVYLVSSIANAQQPIRVVADEWPPFSGDSLINKGLSLDVIATALRRAGYEVETEILPWARIVNGARSGEYDVVGSMFRVSSVESFMTYSKPYYQTEIRFVQRRGGTLSYTDLDSLRAHSIAVSEGFFYEENFDRAEYLKKIVVTTTSQAMQMVATDRAQLALDSKEVIDYIINVENPTLAAKIEFLPQSLAEHGIYLAVGNTVPNRDQILLDFNRTLEVMRVDGSLANLLQIHISR